jgi:hypothetical protein
MASYKVKFYKGDYSERQQAANNDNAVCYVEHHFNGGSPSANYALVVVASNSSSASRDWGKAYGRQIAEAFDIRNNGISVGGYNGRGNGNLSGTKMPAILLEPFFITNKDGANWAKTRQEELASILVKTIHEFFPQGGLIALSVGHKYKKSKPNDRGVQAVTGEWEADLAEQVLLKAKALLEKPTTPPPSDDNDEPIPVSEVSEWAREAHKWVIAKGVSDGTRPHDPVTREEVWVMLHRALNPPAPKTLKRSRSVSSRTRKP